MCDNIMQECNSLEKEGCDMQVDGAVVKEHGQTFSIIIVQRHVLDNNSEADQVRRAWASVFPSPIILMAQDNRGVPTYQGRTDIVRFLANIDHRRIPWKRYTID